MSRRHVRLLEAGMTGVWRVLTAQPCTQGVLLYRGSAACDKPHPRRRGPVACRTAWVYRILLEVIQEITG